MSDHEKDTAVAGADRTALSGVDDGAVVSQEEIVTEQDYVDSLSEEERTRLRDTLLEWREAGNPDPRIYSEVDIAGDGYIDYFVLDADDNLVLMPGVEVDQSDYDLTDVEIVEETDGLGE